jgi:MoxR-like ATPase
MNSPPSKTATDSAAHLAALLDNVESVFRGKRRVVRMTLTCLIARGHLLLEDVPGVGKTTLALAMARSLGVDFKRIQFTSDLLPADIVGVSIWSQTRDAFDFNPGPIFSNIVLADEINRTTPRSQSALLEAMSEGRVSVDNVTHELPDPFLVIATQNPLEHHGTYPLPESQLDRFLMRLSVGYPERAIERAILLERGGVDPVHALDAVLDREAVVGLQKAADRVRVDDGIVDYILDVIEATRRDPRVRIGVSTRGALAMIRACRALAVVEGRDFVVPDDARELVVPVLAHRLSLTGSADADMQRAEAVMEELASRVEVPK